MESARLEVGIYQIADDAMLKANRTDGTGWEWGWADWQREWMDATPSRHAYRCLPLTIANQTGWWIRNPVGFSAVWRGRSEPGSIDFHFDAAGEVWKDWVNNQFGEGIITWNTPFLFRTNPRGSRLLICGPANYFIRNAHPLMALIESDWMTMSFTMNWKIMAPEEPVRFDVGTPLFQAIPLVGNVCADLEGATVNYQKLADDPETMRAYQEWNTARRQFHEQKASGGVRADGWQKDYFRGRDVTGREVAPAHNTKVKPPAIRYLGSTAPAPRPQESPSIPEERILPMPRDQRQRPGPAETDRGPRNGSTLPDRSADERAVATATLIEPDPRVEVRERAADRQTSASTATLVEPDPREARPAAAEPAQPAGRVDDEWRRWIAENLLLGEPRDRVVEAMVSAQVDREEAAREVDLAMQSPYLRGSERLRNRLKKRDWLLAAYRKLNRLHPVSDQIERRDRLSREEFLGEYYTTNRPVIITGMMDDWPAMRSWSLDYFAERFGDREVEVQFGRNAGDNYETEREKFARTIRFAEFLDMVRTSGVTNDFYLTANNNSNNKKVLSELWDDIIQVPEYLDARDRMGGFLWLGPAGTITPFHHDLTNNFMAQVIGRKRVKVAPSWDLPLMANELHVFSRIDGRVTPANPRPDLDQPQILECILGPGEILFLPVGCLHFVEGVDISVTISFTNFNVDNDFSSFYETYDGV